MASAELEKDFQQLIKTEPTDDDAIIEFIDANDAVCETATYDRFVQHVIATRNDRAKSFLDVLIKKKSYEASEQTLKFTADQWLPEIFDTLLKSQLENMKLSVIEGYLILALKSDNWKSVQRLKSWKEKKGEKEKKEKKEQNAQQFQLANARRDDDEADSSLPNKPKPRRTDSVKGANDDVLDWKIKTNPLHMLVYEKNPLDKAIEYDQELCELANSDRTHKDDYIKLSSQCKRFAVNILECCESDSEVADLIKGVNTGLGKIVRGQFIDFVTHPNCQHFLYGKWRGPMNDTWKGMSKLQRYRHVLQHVIFFSFYSTYNAICPPKQEKVIAMNNFIYFVSSYMFFLGMLLFSVFYDKLHDSYYGHSFVGPDYVVGVWVVTYAIQIIVDFSVTKHPSYRKRWWTWYQIALMTVFLMTGICNLVANWLFTSKYESVQALTWKMGAEGIYAIAITLAFMRIMEWLHLSAQLGPVIISFSQMTKVILRLLVIFAIVLFSFSFGMYRLYKDFRRKNAPDSVNKEEEVYFTTYTSTLKVLFWVIFNYGEPDHAEIPSVFYWNANENEAVVILKHRFTMVIGYIMWAVFHVAFVILLLNMLIAILTTAYESIQENSDAKWKLARTKLWMYFLDDGHAVPPPFNILMYIRKVVQHFRHTPCCNFDENGMAPQRGEDECEEIIQTLVERYEKKMCKPEAFQDRSHCERKSYVEMRKENQPQPQRESRI